MIYTIMTNKALRIAYDAHYGQNDLAGIPYIFHPLHLAEQMDDEDSICVALLHDVIEDTTLSLDDIRAEGFSNAVINALRAITHSKDDDYMQYIYQLSKDPLARKVKLADLKHNMDLTRLPELNDKALERLNRYRDAIALLEHM